VADVVAIVGAGPGLGSAMARRFADGGWSVGLVARRDGAVTTCQQQLVRYGVPTHGAVGDVVDAASVDAALRSICDTLGVPQIVVYNASVYQAEPVLELTPEALDLALGVHVKGALNTAQSAVPLMRDGGGVLVFTVNNLARMPEADAAALSIGKGAQLNLALSLELELANTGIDIAIVKIEGAIAAGTAFDPAKIAEVYWAIANQDPGSFRRDHVFDGA
jgi:NAD(P)-dependent dehydrogenase (short-subunit alcohol dehydrogenase family)